MEAIEVCRILCPINFSDGARRIVEGASILAAMYGAELRLLHVVCDSSHERDAESLLASLFALTRRLPERTRVSAALAYGDPSSEITQHARLTSADLIVLGTDRRSAPEQVKTTTAADVAAHAPCPVLHVRPHLLPSLSARVRGFAEILCCADSLRGSNEGDAYAHALAGYSHARVTRVNVLGNDDDATESAQKANDGDGENHVVHISLTGSLGPEIVALAQRIQSDLIVMGAVDGTSDTPRLGSTTAYVMVNAPCPVLIVPPSSDAPHIQANRLSGRTDPFTRRNFSTVPLLRLPKAMANASDPLDNTINRIKSEYREMPGLQLTFEQMLRLWRLDQSTCRTLVEKLIDAQFLKTTRDGRYVRCDVP